MLLKTTITFIFIFCFVRLGGNIFLLLFYPRFSVWGERYRPSAITVYLSLTGQGKLWNWKIYRKGTFYRSSGPTKNQFLSDLTCFCRPIRQNRHLSGTLHGCQGQECVLIGWNFEDLLIRNYSANGMLHYRNDDWVVLCQVCYSFADRISKMAATGQRYHWTLWEFHWKTFLWETTQQIEYFAL